MARRYVSNKNESVRMFESDFLEFFSHVHPITPLVLYIPVVAWMLYRAIVELHLEAAPIAGMFLLGLLIWTFTEYTLHRFLFHLEGDSPAARRFHFFMHGVHHDYPNDGTRLVMPPGASIPLAFLFYGLFKALFGPALTPPVFAGMVTGYLCYDMLHYATHHFPMKRGVFKFLKQYHLKHHFKTPDRGYGVSNPLWDYVFRTRPD